MRSRLLPTCVPFKAFYCFKEKQNQKQNIKPQTPKCRGLSVLEVSEIKLKFEACSKLYVGSRGSATAAQETRGLEPSILGSQMEWEGGNTTTYPSLRNVES